MIDGTKMNFRNSTSCDGGIFVPLPLPLFDPPGFSLFATLLLMSFEFMHHS